MTSMLRGAIAIAAALLLSACADQLPPLNFAPANVGPSHVKIDAELKNVTVTVANQNEATGQLDWAAETVTPMWKDALVNSLDRMALFKDDAPTKVSLMAKILKYDYPEFGGEMVTTVAARYEIINRENGSIIYTQDIQTDGAVPFDYAFIGAIRARESVSRAVQNNIVQFLQALETVDIDRPMFPVAQK